MDEKFKLLKDLPDIKAGSIGYMSCNYINHVVFQSDEDDEQTYYRLDFVKSKTDWFSPYLFTTEDGVELYLGEEMFTVSNQNFISQWKVDYVTSSMFKEYDRVFSTKEKAEQYLKNKNYDKI